MVAEASDRFTLPKADMARLTIGIDASALSVGKRVSLSLKPSATAADVIRAVLKECRVSALPGQYALWVSGNQTGSYITYI